MSGVTPAKLAVLHDPLVGAICTSDEIWQMVDEMVVAQAQMPPQYAGAIAGAKERLAKGSVKTRDRQGAACKEVRSSSSCARWSAGITRLPTSAIGVLVMKA